MDLRPSLIKISQELLNKSTRNNLKSKYIYYKINTYFKSSNTPKLSLDELRNVKGIGIKTLKVFQDAMEAETKEQNAAGRVDERAYPVLDKPSTLSSHDKNFRDNVATPVKRSKITDKEYIPGYRTGAYAILQVLHMEDGISKHRIAYKAAPLCDAEFDFTSRNSAWSGMKTLIKKGLVYIDNKKYFLTEKGSRIASSLRIEQAVYKEDNLIKLVIDNREMKNRRCRSYFQSFFDGIKICNVTRSLDLGDFLWVKNEKVLPYIIERKCGSDFSSSIKDGRFKEQKNRLMKCGIKNRYYIVEGLKKSCFDNPEYGFTCMTLKKLEGFIVIETTDINETGKVIEYMHKVVNDRYGKKALEVEKDGLCLVKPKEEASDCKVKDNAECKTAVDCQKASNAAKPSKSSLNDNKASNNPLDITSNALNTKNALCEGVSNEDLSMIEHSEKLKKLSLNSLVNFCDTSDMSFNSIEVVDKHEKILDSENKIDTNMEQIMESKIKANTSESMIKYSSFIDKSGKNRNTTPKQILYLSFLSIRGITHEKAMLLTNFFKTFTSFYRQKDMLASIVKDLPAKFTSKQIKSLQELLL